jgi:O-antigen/teichoic acid export membrane protein
MNRAYFDGRPDYAKGLGRDFLRGGLWIFPLAGMIAGVSSEITLLAYGPEFAPAGPVLSVLFFAGTSSLMGTTCHAVLMVTDKTRWILWISVVPLVVALGLYPFLIPRFGPLGAAASTLSGAGAGLTLALLMVWKLWRLAPPPGTAVRAAIVTVGAFWFASSWETSSVWLLPKLLSVTLLIPVAFLTLGEFKGSEIRAAVRFLRKGIGDVGRPFNRDRIQ